MLLLPKSAEGVTVVVVVVLFARRPEAEWLALASALFPRSWRKLTCLEVVPAGRAAPLFMLPAEAEARTTGVVQRRPAVGRASAGFTATVASVVRRCPDAMLHYTGQHRLHVLGYNMAAIVDQCPGTRTMQKSERAAWGKSERELAAASAVPNKALHVFEQRI